jgi:hypothetical protein
LQSVRILLAGMSNMLFSLVTAALSEAPDIVIAGRIAGSGDLATEIRLASADAVIVQTDLPGTTDVFVPLLSAFPNLAVVAIDSGCTGGFVHRQRPCSLRLPEISSAVLQAVLHAQPGSDGRVLL